MIMDTFRCWEHDLRNIAMFNENAHNEEPSGAPVRLALASYLLLRASFVAETIESRLFDPPQLTIDLPDGGES